MPVFDDSEIVEELNRFLRSHRVLEESHELVTTKNGAYLHFCVKYLPSMSSKEQFRGKIKVNYQEVLSKEDFQKFLDLKKIRKNLADINALPAYAIFTDQELADISKLERLSEEEMAKIPGIGKSKVSNYAQIMIKRYNEMKENEKSKQSLL